MVADYKGRFGMFTTLPLPDVDNTLAEIAYGMDTLKAQGVGMMTSYGTKYLGDPAFAPVMAELNRRSAAVFVHPLQPACCTNVVAGVPDVVVEYGTETSRTIASLLMNHTTMRYPDIRFIFSHGGGAVPFLTFRFNRMVSGDAGADEGRTRRRDRADPKALFRHRAGLEPVHPALARPRLMPVEHIVFGSDFPAASPLDTVKGLKAFGLSEDALAKIQRGNAQRILANMS